MSSNALVIPVNYDGSCKPITAREDDGALSLHNMITKALASRGNAQNCDQNALMMGDNGSVSNSFIQNRQI